MDEETRAELDEIRSIANVAMGEALAATLLLFPLLGALARGKALSRESATYLIDTVLLSLEEADGAAPVAGKPALQHTRGRLNTFLPTLSPDPRSTSTARRKRGRPKE